MKETNSKKLTVIIVDDEELARRGLAMRLEEVSELEILEQCQNAREALDAINKLLSHNFKIKYLTNTTVTPRRQILKKLLKFKLPITETDIFTPPIAAGIFLKKNKISKIFLLTNQLLQEDFKEFIIDEVKPEAIILGDLYKAKL